ncbi:MAG: TM0106 family RecB-like putative nuclease [Spirochaetales bacterium]|nr:TM0106 family RecB-like putative nuclease [Spirochaetales bacterium]
MKIKKNSIRLAPTDLGKHLSCRHLTGLDYLRAKGERKPQLPVLPLAETLQRLGEKHEADYVEHLKRSGRQIVQIRKPDEKVRDAELLAATVVAMKQGAEIIYQGALADDLFFGLPDFLRRMDEAGKPTGPDGFYRYEVLDTKLSRETRAGSVLQLAVYSHMLAQTQKSDLPARMIVVQPGGPDNAFQEDVYQTAHFSAFYRQVRARLVGSVAALDGGPLETEPDPVEHCNLCLWRADCYRFWKDADHLSLVAGITRLQRRVLVENGIETLAALAKLPVPLPQSFELKRGTMASLLRSREQARVQDRGRTELYFETLDPEQGQGLALLPEPSAGDLFFDIEGARFYRDGGLEYQFGWAFLNENEIQYECLWAANREQEKQMLEAFIDMVMARLQKFPDLHIYHFAPYEPATLKRLMGRYGTRESEIDDLLRLGVFVDLYAVVRHAILAGVESYSIKKLEPFYGLKRDADLPEATRSRRALEQLIEDARPLEDSPQDKALVEAYNRDDCVSTYALRQWLETLRSELVKDGHDIERPTAGPAQTQAASAAEERIRDLMDALAQDVPVEQAQRSKEEHARWLLAQLLMWHRREDRAVWWRFFELRDMSDEDRLNERDALSELSFDSVVDPGKGILRYRYAKQEVSIRRGDDLCHSRQDDPRKVWGSVQGIDRFARTIDVKRKDKELTVHQTSVFAHKYVPGQAMQTALQRVANYVIEHGIEGRGRYHCGRRLLLGEPPAALKTTSSSEKTLERACRIVKQLDGDLLAIQGPPGSGKTYTGAHMICALVEQGKKVGITAVGHAAIRNLLLEVKKAAIERGQTINLIQAVDSEKYTEESNLTVIRKNAAAAEHILKNNDWQVVGGSVHMWARADVDQGAGPLLDVLFVDEAGQMSLANAIAASQAARSLVLLGDPQQLAQPSQGSHPEGAGASALEHWLGDEATMPPGQGLFLNETYRLHPKICEFTSRLFYDGQLTSVAGLAEQRLKGQHRFTNSGLYFVPVEHSGNQSSSEEEVAVVRQLIAELLDGPSSKWTDRSGNERTLELSDILVVTPYNVQATDIEIAVTGVRVGTADRFQGQEAPVVIYSMTTSSAEEAPRGMDFLYSPNRFNVATSRARSVSILVASPRLLEAECRTPKQMRLVNALCAYREMATVLELS